MDLLLKVAFISVGVAFLVYLLIRLGSAAYFRSKSDYEKGKNEHGNQS